jgi:hypothetical protein
MTPLRRGVRAAARLPSGLTLQNGSGSEFHVEEIWIRREQWLSPKRRVERRSSSVFVTPRHGSSLFVNAIVR